METKIYREEENEQLIVNEELLKEYNELAEELGYKPMSTEETKKDKCPNVYICLNTAMDKQLAALCPNTTKAEDYKRSTIPVEVLRVLKYAKDQEMFDGYYIIYDDVKADPMLIGWKLSDNDKINNYTWNKVKYLIARWGDEALELNELLEKGYERMKQEMVNKVIEAITECNAIIANPDVYMSKVLKGSLSDIDIRPIGHNGIM